MISNDVYLVPVGDVVARVRLQCHDGGVTFRAAPGKGDSDESVALAAIDVLTGYLRARGNAVRVYFRRHRNGSQSEHDVLDAVSVFDLDMHDPQASALELLHDFQRIASATLH